jgi:TolB-like protein/DNA-binding winged helix-turn-helix (wHTH) protein/tetratricopeptide (TPR) repeat protein
MQAHAAIIRFGPYELRSRTRELYKYDTKLKLRAQPFQLLQALLERRGDVLTREELRELLWTKETFVDFEHGLNAAISELRGMLNDTASDPRYIETIPKLGYRIKVPVEVVEREPNGASASASPAPGSTVAVEGSQPVGRVNGAKKGWWRWMVAAGIIVAVFGAVAGYREWKGHPGGTPQQNDRVMLAVLPFQNLTGDAGQEYFSDGLTEEMIAQLGLMDPEHFGVIARTSVMHYKTTQQNAEQIGRELGVQYVLEGSVRRDTERVRITAQLVRTADQTRLWTKEFDRELQNLLGVQSEIALDTGNEIRQTLGAKKPRGKVVAPVAAAMSREGYESYDQYLKGLYLLNKRTLPGFEQAIACFQRAIKKNPQYAPAYAGLANSYTLLTGYSMSPSSRYMPQARTAALRAVELNDKLPEAHTALVLVVQNYDWDWQMAEKEFKRAIELNPNYATAHHWYAEHLGFRGRFEEAFRESDEAKRLDPLSLIIAVDHGVLLYFARDYDRAIEQFRVVLEMDPDFTHAHMIQNVYAAKGMYKEAIADIENGKRGAGLGPWYWSAKARVYGQWGRQAQAHRALQALEEMNKRHPVDPAPLAWAHMGMGHREEALRWLEKAYDQHSSGIVTLKVEPIYDPVRSDPRFTEIIRKMQFPE